MLGIFLFVMIVFANVDAQSNTDERTASQQCLIEIKCLSLKIISFISPSTICQAIAVAPKACVKYFHGLGSHDFHKANSHNAQCRHFL
jgi:hypothetical protein